MTIRRTTLSELIGQLHTDLPFQGSEKEIKAEIKLRSLIFRTALEETGDAEKAMDLIAELFNEHANGKD